MPGAGVWNARAEQGGGRGAGQIILRRAINAGSNRGDHFTRHRWRTRFLLGVAAPTRLRGAVLLALFAKTTTMLDSLADYPRWFVVACGTIVAALLVWVGMKLLKLALWLLLAVVLVVGLGTAAWLLVK